MGYTDLDSVDYTDMQGISYGTSTSKPYYKTEQLYEVDSLNNDVVTWQPEWTKWHGYYRQIPELKAVIDKKAMWVIGKGYEAKDGVKKILGRIKGNGSDIFDSIIMNLVTVYTICGDSFAEIMRDKAGRLINLKPLNPGSIKIIADKYGMIKEYNQVTYQWDEKGQSRKLEKWQPNEIFHLSWNRVADEIHGIPTIEKLEQQIKKINQAKDLNAVIVRRHVMPVKVWEVDTDDPTEIAAFKTKVDNVVKFIENIVVPKGTASAIIHQMQRGAIDEVSGWIKTLEKQFIIAEGIPEVILGSGTETTEATSKILYLAFQQVIEWNQLFLEKQIKKQLGIDLKYNFPASIDPALLADSRKNKGDKTNDLNPAKENK